MLTGPSLPAPRWLAAPAGCYKRQSAAYTDWLAAHAADHGDAFTNLVGAEGAVTAWRRDLITARSSPATVNQALAAVTLMYQQGLRIAVKRVRIPRPGEPDALTPQQEAALRRAAARRGPRDAAIIAVLLNTGARAEECARLDAEDFAITARAGEVRLHGKESVRFVPLSRRARELASAWLDVRGRDPGPAWTGQRGPLTISGITQVVLAARADAGISPGLRPHRCRDTFATRLRQGGADPAQVQALLGHASIDTAARYFRAGSAENAAVIAVSRDEFPVLRTVARWPGFLVTCCHLHPVAAVQVAAARRVAWWYHRAMAWCRLRRADQRNLKASWARVRSPPAQSAARRASRAVSATESLIRPSWRGRGWPG